MWLSRKALIPPTNRSNFLWKGPSDPEFFRDPERQEINSHKVGEGWAGERVDQESGR